MLVFLHEFMFSLILMLIGLIDSFTSMKQKAKPLHIISDHDVADCGGGKVMDVNVGGIIGGTCIHCFYFCVIKQFVK